MTRLSRYLLLFFGLLWLNAPPATFAASFPGAEGYGATASGGRGGTVYHVTSLADSGTNTLRDAVSQPYRTIVFDVGGLITLQSDLSITNSNLTIAGQTAPGQGIGIYGNGNFGVKLYNQIATNVLGTNYWLCPGSTNIIIRYLRFREGYNSAFGNWSLAMIDSKSVMLDHCSIELGCWQTMCMTIDPWAPPGYPSDSTLNVTVQNCIVGASIGNQLGCLMWGAVNSSFSHNLWIDNAARDPKVEGNVQLINDVLYNPQLAIYGDGGEQVDFVGNYHIAGPTFPEGDGIYVSSNYSGGGSFYYTNNLLDANVNGKLDGSLLVTNSDFDPVTISATPYCTPTIPVTIDPPALAYYKVGSQAGCSLARDSIDNTLISQLLSLGKLGQRYTNESQFGPMTIAGGPTLPDTDQDGMPDEWELATGSNYQVADNNVVAANGYTLLENYLNWLAAPHTKTYRNLTAPDFDLWPFTMPFTNQSPVYTLFSPTNGTVTLVSNRYARFAPMTNITGLGGFTFTVQAADGTIMTNTVGVLVSPLAPPTNLVWRGDNYTNVWQLYTTNDWFNGSTLQAFNGSDNVTFDDTGSNSLPVSIIGQLSPASLIVNAAKNYTFGGSGALVGNLALTKMGAGSLTLNTANTFNGGLTITNSTVTLGNVNGAGTGIVTLENGATFSANGYSPGNAIFVAAGATATIDNTWNSPGFGGSISSGAGTAVLTINNTSLTAGTDQLDGFTGTVNIGTGNVRFSASGSNGGTNTTFNLIGTLYTRNAGSTENIGALTGTGTLQGASGSEPGAATICIGAKNINSIFTGVINESVTNSQTTIVKIGAGTLTLTGASTYTGGTSISNGTLLVNNALGSGTGTNFVNVYAGATLGGTGSIAGPVTILAGGILSPGSPTGTLSISNSLMLNSAAVASFGLGTNIDRVAVKGNLALGGTLNTTNLGGLFAGTNTLFTYTGTLSGSLALGTMPVGFKFVLATNVSGQVNLIAARPVIATTTMVSTNFILTGTGGLATSNYYVLAATNLALPLTNWTRLATNQFDGQGNFRWTNSAANVRQKQFYLLQFP